MVTRSVWLVPLGLATAAVGYAAGIERRTPVLRRVTVPVLPEGERPLRVLHISDAHLTPRQGWKRRWLRKLDDLQPDVIVNTGDSIAHPEAVPAFVDAIQPLLARPGVFVLGSNDRYAPRFKNPLRYLLPDDGRRVHGPMLPWRELVDSLERHGWRHLGNARAVLEIGGRRVEFRGVDDPHIWCDRYDDIAGPVDRNVLIGIGVTHSPEPRVVSRMAADGCRLVLAGHTHGGQLRVPFYGALVTNCGLDRRRARGLSRYDATWLHVSAGLGTSPLAPVRFSCPPEATLITLVGRDHAPVG
ncbi:metallophosphoesterase [Acidothermus cellulolyticus 11B]|uniref:Metallophosphoesterase n=1 Tax=Acidothermus cellulolyticus (strain ATCC 43068 / DSM 8971 / 11B) TaxID=351607 RepID=A0LWG8_ACIC1|nr:metallophosphoesterase [Acidothermus cellulolyticus]ABK53778.1 metallophosphoesterase [Acidothermus cellulolyticus 11B]